MLWLFLLFSAGSLLVMIINQLKIRNFTGAADVAKKAESQVDDKASRIESLVIRGQDGNKLPKSAYWVLANVEGDKLKVKIEDNITDSGRLVSGIESGRIAYLYRAGGRNVIFGAKLFGDTVAGIYRYIELVPVDGKTTVLDAFGNGKIDDRSLPMTLIGFPAELFAKK
jgi:hypothetical protein